MGSSIVYPILAHHGAGICIPTFPRLSRITQSCRFLYQHHGELIWVFSWGFWDSKLGLPFNRRSLKLQVRGTSDKGSRKLSPSCPRFSWIQSPLWGRRKKCKCLWKRPKYRYILKSFLLDQQMMKVMKTSSITATIYCFFVWKHVLNPNQMLKLLKADGQNQRIHLDFCPPWPWVTIVQALRWRNSATGRQKQSGRPQQTTWWILH